MDKKYVNNTAQCVMRAKLIVYESCATITLKRLNFGGELSYNIALSIDKSIIKVEIVV